MRIIGNLTLAGLGQIQNLRVENVAVDPATPSVGQIWYNTTEGIFKGWDGTTVTVFATGGNTDVLLSEIDAIELSVGLNEDGSFIPYTGTSYLNAATTVVGATVLLDTQVKANADALAAAGIVAVDAQTEIDAIETSAGLNADGSFTAPAGTTYLGGALTLVGADVLLDTATKAAADAAIAAQNTADTKVTKAGDSMSGNLAFGGTSKVIGLASPENAGDAANKGYVDAIAAGLTWEAPVQGIAADHTVGSELLALGARIANTTDDKIYTVTAAGVEGGPATFDAGELLVDGAAFFDNVNETGYVFNGTELVQFTGTGQLTAGVGLAKTGNTIDVNLGAGIGQLPSDEVGIDVLATGGLITTIDGTTSSTETAAQLAILLDGASLQTTAAGIRVKAAGITATELALDVAGAGLVGGEGTALAVGSGTGITVLADSIELDLGFTDARYINADGDTLTGPLVLAADPVSALEAATKAYVDALALLVRQGTYLYTGGVASTIHTVVHTLNNQYNTVTVYDSADKVIIPESITADSTNQLTVTFAAAITCKVVVTGVQL